MEKGQNAGKKVPKLYKQQAVISVPGIIFSAAADSCDLMNTKNPPAPRLIGILISQITKFLDQLDFLSLFFYKKT